MSRDASSNIRKALLGVFSLFLVAPFSVSADTIYQQLIDSSSEVTLYSGIGTCTATSSNIATFIAPITTTPGATSFAYGVFFNNTGGPNTINITISSTTNYNALHSWSLSVPSSDADQFLEVTGHSGVAPLIAGQTYVVHGCDVGSEVTKTRSNLSEDFWYGYITDNGVESVPVAPGIPGFTDVGIATTSQQVWCAGNFSTSSGFLDTLGQSISLGFCNVGVFLFVPSQSAVSQWQALATTSREKIPFSYYYDFRDILNDQSASSSENFPSFAVNGADWGIGSTTAIGNIVPNLTFLSTSTISQYLPPGMYDLLFLLMRSAIWMMVLFHVYRRIVPKNATDH